MAGFDPTTFRNQAAQQYTTTGVPPISPTQQQPTSVAGSLFKPWYDAGILTADPAAKEQQGFWRRVGEDALTLGLAPAALLATIPDLIMHPVKTTKQIGTGLVHGVVDMFKADEWKKHPFLNLVNTVANVSVVGGVAKSVALGSARETAFVAAKSAAIEAGAESAMINATMKSSSFLKPSIFEAVRIGSFEPVVSTLRTVFEQSGLSKEVATGIARDVAQRTMGSFLTQNGAKITALNAFANPVGAFGDFSKVISRPVMDLVFGSPAKSAVGKLYGSELVAKDVQGFGMVEEWAGMQTVERGWKNTVENRVRVMQEWTDENSIYSSMTPEGRVAHFKEYASADVIRNKFAESVGRDYVLTKALPANYVESMAEYAATLDKGLTNAQVIEKLTEQYGKDFASHADEVAGRLGDKVLLTDRPSLLNAVKALANDNVPVTFGKLTAEETTFIDSLQGSGYRIGRAPEGKIISQAVDVTGNMIPKSELLARRSVIGRLVDKLGLSPEGVVEGTQAFAFREAFTQGVLTKYGAGKTITINGIKYPVEALPSTLERLRKGIVSSRSSIRTSIHSVADLRYGDLLKSGFSKADAKALDGLIRESNVASPAITGIGEALSNIIRTRNNPLSRAYNNFLRVQSDLRFKKNPMFGAQAAVEAVVWGNMWAKTMPGSRTVLSAIQKIRGLETPLIESMRPSTLAEEKIVLSEVMDEFTRQLRDAGMSPEIQRGLVEDISKETPLGVAGKIEEFRFQKQNLDSNVWLGAAGFSNVRLTSNLMRSYAGRFGMKLEDALAFTIKDGKKVYDNPWIVQNMRDAAQSVFGYKTGVLTSPFIRTMNTVFFPIRFQTKTLIQTAEWINSISPMSRLAVMNSWVGMAHWLSTPEGDKWRTKNRGTMASLFNYVFAFEGIGKSVDAATRGQLFGGNTGLIGGLPFGFIANIARDLGYTAQDTQINLNTGMPYQRTVIKDAASFRGFVTVVEDIILSMTPAMPFTTATGGAVTVSATREVKKFIEQVLQATAGALPGVDEEKLKRDFNRQDIKVRPGYHKNLPNPLNLLAPEKAEASAVPEEYMRKLNSERLKVVSSFKSKEGITINKLKGGAEVHALGAGTKAEMAAAYKAHPELPKGILEAVYEQESSAGTNRRNEKFDQGAFGWMVGFTKTAYQGVVKDAKKGDPRAVALLAKLDFRTKKAALLSAAAFLDFRSKIYTNAEDFTRMTDPVQIYSERYNGGGAGDKFDSQEFSDFVRYHAGAKG